MFRFLRSKKSQIRGVDFTVAMIIFMLTMINVLVLTNNLIINTKINSNLEQRGNQSQQVLNTLVDNYGTTNWESLPVSSLSKMNWTVGLLGNNEDIDPYKLSRLVDTNLPDYNLNYSYLGKHLPSENKVYRLEVFSPINNTILSTKAVTNNINIVGYVSKNNEPLENVNINLFSIKQGSAGNASIQQTFAKTNSSGYYDITFTAILPANFIAFISFANYLNLTQDVSFSTYTDVGATFTRTDSSIFKETSSSLQNINLRVKKETGNNISQAWTFFTGVQSGEQNYTEIPSSQIDYSLANYFNISRVSIPPTGYVAVFSIQNSSFTNGFYSIDILPALLDNDIYNVRRPTSYPNALSSTSTLTALVRNVIIFIRLTTWEVEL